MESKNSIFIVDDSPENIEILVELLDPFDLTIANNGETALKIINNDYSPDLILLDIMMPGMSGYDVAEQLQSNPSTKDIPIIYLTAKTDTQSVLHGLETGAVDFVSKPFNTAELLARVSTQLKLKNANDTNRRHILELEEKNKQIMDSIDYAYTIQKSMLPKAEVLNDNFNDHFIFYAPRDIVSGDFYWFKNVEDKIIVIVADCTGHGVPGAFMSMLGTALLNEVVVNEKETDPAKILSKVRTRTISSLNETEDTMMKDGMDMAVLCFDSKANVLSYSGAYCPLYWIRENEIHKIQADRMPLALYSRSDDFNTHKIDLKQGDQFYIFTDGYADQLGGEKHKKFLYPRFRKLLLQNADKPMREQREMLCNAFDHWRGAEDQTDDVLVVGLKYGTH